MFQNIQDFNENIQYKKEEKRRLNIFSNIITKNNIILYILVFMVSTIGIGQDVSPFSLAIAAACIAAGIPIFGVAIFGVAGNIIAFGTAGALNYMVILLVMIITMFIYKPAYNDENRNEKMKIAKNLFLSVFMVQIVKLLASTVTIYDGLMVVTTAVITVVFYKIFVNSVVVVKEFTERSAFSIEEVMGASMLLAIAVSAIRRFFDIWIFNQKYFEYFNSASTWLEKWIISWNNNRCCNRCNIRCYSRNTTCSNSCLCNFRNACGNIK